MISIDMYSRVPVYEQIQEQIIWLINSGAYKPDDKLPSIRLLASELGLNVNTVKRAFQELEAKGIVYSAQGRGVFVNPFYDAHDKIKQEAIADLKISLNSAVAKGLTRGEIDSVVDEVFNLRVTDIG